MKPIRYYMSKYLAFGIYSFNYDMNIIEEKLSSLNQNKTEEGR